MKVYRSEKAAGRILETYDRLLALWGVDTAEMDVATRYGATHVVACGREDAPPLVLFHGVGDDSALMWLYNAKALAEHFRVYAIDTIGGPGKSRANARYDKDFDDAEWIDDVLDGLGLGQVRIAGVSHGAYLAQYYGACRPERVMKILCMAGSVPVGGGSPMKTMMKIFVPEALFPTRKNTVRLLKKLCGKHAEVFTEQPAVLEHYHGLLKGFNNMAMRFHKVESLSDAQIDALRDKCLFLIGEDDPFAKLGGKEQLSRYQMRARFFPEVGHGINHEIAETVNRIAVDYFSE